MAVAAWSGSLARAGFSFDDREVLEANPVVSGALPWWSAFDRDYWHHRGAAGHYRPLASLALRADRRLHGDAPAGYHATNVALHALVVALAWCVAARLTGGPGTGVALGLAVFAAHPALADSVAWISGRTSSLAAAGGLLGALGVLALGGRPGRRGAVSAGACAGLGLLLGLLGKEDAVVFAVALPLCALRHGRSRAAAALAGVAAGLAAYLALRAAALGSPWPAAPHAPLADAPLATRLAVGGRAACEALRIVALPLHHPPGYPSSPLLVDPAAPAAAARAWLGWSWVAALIAAGAAFLLRALRRGPTLHARAEVADPGARVGERGPPGTHARAGAGRRRGAPVAGHASAVAARKSPVAERGSTLPPRGSTDAAPVAAGGALLAGLAALPVMQVVPAGELLAPRFLYLPLLLAAPVVGSALAAGARGLGAPRLAPAALVAALAAGAWVRAGVYADRGTFREAILRHLPEDVGSWNDLGLAREARGDRAGAEEAWRRAVLLDPGYSRAWSNLGRLALERGDRAAAERAWRRAVDVGRRNPVAHCNLGNLLRRSGRPEEAIELFRTAAALAPGMAAAWRGLGRALLEAGRPAEARTALERALAANPADATARALLERLAPP